jgi:hypothetical protein
VIHLLHGLLLAGGALAGYSLYKNASTGAAPSAGPVTPAVGSPASPSVAGYAQIGGSSAAHAGVHHYHGHGRGFFGSAGHPQVGMRVGAKGPGIGAWNNPYFHHVGVNQYRMPPHVGAGFGHPNPHNRGFIGRV